MTYVVQRRGGQWEVRESVATQAGPRSRTLATFRTLTSGLAVQAARKASRPTNPDEVLAAGRRAGAPVVGSDADHSAALLLRELDRGAQLSERLRRALADRLGPGSLPDQARQTVVWSAATPAERGDTLWDLMEFGDSLPYRERENAPRMPRLVSQ